VSVIRVRSASLIEERRQGVERRRLRLHERSQISRNHFRHDRQFDCANCGRSRLIEQERELTDQSGWGQDGHPTLIVGRASDHLEGAVMEDAQRRTFAALDHDPFETVEHERPHTFRQRGNSSNVSGESSSTRCRHA
jgi:hypothetical protein